MAQVIDFPSCVPTADMSEAEFLALWGEACMARLTSGFRGQRKDPPDVQEAFAENLKIIAGYMIDLIRKAPGK